MSSRATDLRRPVRKRRTRRWSALLVVLAGFVSLTSALSQPMHDRLHLLLELFPIAVPQTAAALTALDGLGLLLLARGLLRGQRRAWAATTILLVVAGVLHLIKGVDFEEAALALAVAGFLWAKRDDFRVRASSSFLDGGLGMWGLLAVATLAAGTAGIELGVAVRNWAGNRHQGHLERFSISWPRAMQASAERMIGVDHVALPHRIALFFDPVAATVGFALGTALLMLLFKPLVARHFTATTRAVELARARAVVARYGSGTLDYFALREDKQFFFWGETLVPYGVYGGVCLVSPDPIGPASEREAAWAAFREFVDENGWAVGGLGAAHTWLPIYRATGMRDLYVGDEAVVDIDRFTLEGGHAKGLRQAANRVARNGYQLSFHDPARLPPELRRALGEVITKSRQGGAERGFSMTLGRVFDPEDEGLLLAVVHAPYDATVGADRPTDTPLGRPVAFCQYTPVAGEAGYSLDMMRRDTGRHPNGLIDFAIVGTIGHLRDRQVGFLSLNFATMRNVLAGQSGHGPLRRLHRWVLLRLSRSMQIESLWRFNEKFAPDWHPRYAFYDSPENVPAVALAVARAESWWEIPVLGRFLRPKDAPFTPLGKSHLIGGLSRGRSSASA